MQKTTQPLRRLHTVILLVAVVAAACSSTSNEVSGETAPNTTDAAPTTSTTEIEQAPTPEPGSALSCDEAAALFTTKGSVNANLADPISEATCDGDQLVVTSNGIPDYTYIRTSPGDPNPQDYTFEFPGSPTFASETTDVPALGALGVALNGVPIYGSTEGTGGDVLSLEGALSECGSHNGPTGFHLHLLGTSTTTDCIFTAEEVASAPQLFGYAFDGFPIYTGNAQYTSSWELTDETLFATDTWSAHSYVAGSGDLDECNGLTDADGNYAYYTTDSFPYTLGCFRGEVELGGGGNGGGPPAGEDGGDAAGPPDLTDAADQLGISVEELEAALGQPPFDFDAIAEQLGVSAADVEAAIPAPPGR